MFAFTVLCLLLLFLIILFLPFCFFCLSFYFFSFSIFFFFSLSGFYFSVWSGSGHPYSQCMYYLFFGACLRIYFLYQEKPACLCFSGVRFAHLLDYMKKIKSSILENWPHIAHKWQSQNLCRQLIKHFNLINYMKIIQRHYFIVTNALNIYITKSGFTSQYFWFIYFNII